MISVPGIDAHQVAVGGGYVAMKTHHVDTPLGEETRLTREVFVECAIVDGPEPNRCAIAESEIIAVFGDGQKAVVASRLLVESAQIEQRLGPELVARRAKSPTGVGLLFSACHAQRSKRGNPANYKKCQCT